MSIIKTTNQVGFTLLEVMIALVIFSIGLLGLAGLQSAGVRHNQISYSRTVATQLAYDMADRIRNNPGGNYDSALPDDTPNCVTATCDSGQLASFDRFEWDTALNRPAIDIDPDIKNSAAPLRNAAGFIVRQDTVSGIPFYRIFVTWNEAGDGQPSTAAGDEDECNDPVDFPDVVCITIETYP